MSETSGWDFLTHTVQCSYCPHHAMYNMVMDIVFC